MKEFIVLVNKKDEVIGKEEKMICHKEGKLHRAFSVLIFNSKKEILLQKRALMKYHTPGLWTNTCCSHPRPGEELISAAERRLNEEMGFTTDLKEVFSFHYTSEFDNGLIENEIDHVCIGFFNDEPVINPEEVDDYQWISLDDLLIDISRNAQKYTPWFSLILSDDWLEIIRKSVA